MRSGQGNVPGEWRKRFAKHLEAKLGIAGKDIFNFSAVISMLTEIQPDILQRVVFIFQDDSVCQSLDKICPECVLVGRAEV